MSDLQELSVYAIFSIIVITKVLDFLRSRTLSPEQQAQNEFYQTFSQLCVEWRAAGQDLQEVLEIVRDGQYERKLNHQELVNKIEAMTYKCDSTTN